MFIFGDSSLCRTRQPAWSLGLIATITSRRFFLACTGFQCASESSTRRRCLCGSAYMMQPLAIWLICVCRPTPYMVASNYVPYIFSFRLTGLHVHRWGLQKTYQIVVITHGSDTWSKFQLNHNYISIC